MDVNLHLNINFASTEAKVFYNSAEVALGIWESLNLNEKTTFLCFSTGGFFMNLHWRYYSFSFVCIYFQSWKDNLEKANNLYQEAKMASLSSLENILFTTYDDEEEDYSGQGYLQAPISRRGSRRSSRYSR